METRPTGALRQHPRSAVVPNMEPDTFNLFVEDIERRGITTPLDITDDGTVIDGRHRLTAALTLGIPDVPVRVVEPDDPFDFMVRAALMRRDLSKSQRAMLALELPEYRQAKADAAERRAANDPRHTRTDTNVRSDPTPTRAADAIADLAGVSGSYIRKAALVADRAPELAEKVRAGAKTVHAAVEEVTGRATREENETTSKPTRRLPVPNRRPPPHWRRHFNLWCRRAMPEDKATLLEMRSEIDRALEIIGGGTRDGDRAA